MTMRVNVLGQFAIISDERFGPARLPKKGKAVLAYLAIVGQPVPRDRLADLLWPFQEQEGARHSLRNCLLEVRKYLGPQRDRLHGDFSSCRLEVETDLTAFLNLVATGGRGELAQAVALVRGELLDGMDLASEPWNQWLQGERDRLRRTLTPVLFKYSETSTAAGLHVEAIAAAQRLVDLDNLHEPSHCRLMAALAAGGQRSGALQQYKKLQKILKDELAVTPDPATRALAEKLAGDDGTPVGRPEPPPLRIVAPVPEPAADPDALTLRLEKLVAEIQAWKGGIARLTRSLIDEIEAVMAEAAADRRHQAELIAIADTAIGNTVSAAA